MENIKVKIQIPNFKTQIMNNGFLFEYIWGKPTDNPFSTKVKYNFVMHYYPNE
jgi:hypothetical protein